MQNAKRKTQNECVAFGDYFNHFPKENTFTLHFALCTLHSSNSSINWNLNNYET